MKPPSVKCLFGVLSFWASALPCLSVEYTATAMQSGAGGVNNVPITVPGGFDFTKSGLDLVEITSITITLTITGAYTAPTEQGSEGPDRDQIVLMLDDIPTELRLNGFPGPTTRLSFDFVLRMRHLF
ncbi:MAG: hypothetical protein M3R13_05390 [Armatimonadota bacterium]|nr:hypothetical protein [Armatimonadota bacterium]